MELFKIIILYVTIHVFTFIIVKYCILRKHYLKNSNGSFQHKFSPFVRKDLDSYHIIYSFPWYITFWPRFLLSWINTILCYMAIVLVMVGADKTRMNQRAMLVTIIIKYCCRVCLILTGNVFINYQKVELDYKQYLGPQWKPNSNEGAIIIGNHISWIEIFVCLIYRFPRLLVRHDAKDSFVIGNMACVLDCIFVDQSREDSKKQTKDLINLHCADFMKGKKKTGLLIFPEGATTNGSQLLQFKKGPFGALAPIQPFLASYDQPMEYSASVAGEIYPQLVFFLCCCKPPWGTINYAELPVFEPNEYFWKHHQQDGESKASCYLRIIRKIMLENSRLKDSKLDCSDRLKYQEALNDYKF